jgi:hypothetical protein
LDGGKLLWDEGDEAPDVGVSLREELLTLLVGKTRDDTTASWVLLERPLSADVDVDTHLMV